MLTLKEQRPPARSWPNSPPAAGELVVRKTVPSAFFGTPLGAWLTDARRARRWWSRAR